VSKSDDLHLIEKQCSVTAFDLRVVVSRDGRKRGLWIGVRDNDGSRRKIHLKWLQQARDAFLDSLGFPPLTAPSLEEIKKRAMAEAKFGMYVADLLKPDIDSMGLLEWDELQDVYDAIGKELKKRPRDDE